MGVQAKSRNIIFPEDVHQQLFSFRSKENFEKLLKTYWSLVSLIFREDIDLEYQEDKDREKEEVL